MSRHYKAVHNGNGTNLTINESMYLAVGPKGKDVMLRGAGKVIAFDRWDDLVEAIDVKMAAYFKDDKSLFGEMRNTSI